MNRPAPEPDTRHEVEGRFQDGAAVARAIDALADEKIPDDQIRVYVDDGTGRREIGVKERMGALRGALIGGAGGGLFGTVAVAVGATLLGVSGNPLASGLVTGALQGFAAGALTGVVIGGFLGLGHWSGAREVDRHLRPGHDAVVQVRGEGLIERARGALTRAGAIEVRSPA